MGKKENAGKSKLKLDELKIQSFVTVTDEGSLSKAKGGALAIITQVGNCGGVQSTLNPRCNITDTRYYY